MSTNLQTVQHIYTCFSQGDVPGILEKMDESVRWEEWTNNYAQKAGVPWLQAQSGKEGVLAFFQYLGANTKMKDFQVLSIMEGGNQIAVEFILEMEILETGNQLRDEEIHLWTFNEAGKVIRLRHYADTAKHINAANPM